MTSFFARALPFFKKVAEKTGIFQKVADVIRSDGVRGFLTGLGSKAVDWVGEKVSQGINTIFSFGDKVADKIQALQPTDMSSVVNTQAVNEAKNVLGKRGPVQDFEPPSIGKKLFPNRDFQEEGGTESYGT